MNQSLKIVVADDEPEMREYFQETLTAMGHQVLAAAENGTELVEACTTHQPDLVITDIKMPGLDGIQASMEIRQQSRPVPVILVSAYHDEELIERSLRDHVMAYLVKPIKQADLEIAIALATRRFREFLALQEQAASLQQALEDRKVIERAKGILMKRAGLDEPDAFRRLQRLSSEKNIKMVEIARMIVTADEAMGN